MSTSDTELARRLVGLLADPERRAVFAALVLGATTIDQVRSATRLDVRAVVTALGRLVDGELVLESDDQDYFLIDEAFVMAARAAAPPPSTEHDDQPEDVSRVLRAFIRDDHLLSVPTSKTKRLVVLDHLVQDFEPGVRYTEKRVNLILGRWYPDYISLRRWMVDEGFLERQRGEYWRSGGTVR